MRKKIVAGNWKMNNTLFEAQQLCSEVLGMLEQEIVNDVEVVLIPSYPFLYPVSQLSKGISYLAVAAQNCSQFDKGAYTGEVSAPMLKSLGIQYVLIGHSERRHLFNENEQILKEKVDQALKADLKVIFCCGETLAEREAGDFEKVIENQLSASLFHLSAPEWAHIAIAYEPVWAIGTGKTATSQQAQNAHAYIRGLLNAKYDKTLGENCRILYGGSCNKANAAELFAQADIDGGLIGGASLKSRDFVEIVKAAR